MPQTNQRQNLGMNPITSGPVEKGVIIDGHPAVSHVRGDGRSSPAMWPDRLVKLMELELQTAGWRIDSAINCAIQPAHAEIKYRQN